MGATFSFQANSIAGAVSLVSGVAPVFLTSYSFNPTNTNSFGVIATISNNDNIGAIPIWTFPVTDPAGGDATTTSVVSCTPFNNGVLPQQGAATNQLTCDIPVTSIAPGIVTMKFAWAGGGATYSQSYAFSVASSTTTTNTETSTATSFVNGTTVGSTTVTSTQYLTTVSATPTTTLTGASATVYTSCLPTTTSLSSNTTSPTSSTSSISGTVTPPFPANITVTVTSKITHTICPCDSTSSIKHKLLPRVTPTTVLGTGYAPPDFTYIGSGPAVTVSTVTTTTGIVSTTVTSGIDTVTVTSPVTTITETLSATQDDRTVLTVSGCAPNSVTT